MHVAAREGRKGHIIFLEVRMGVLQTWTAHGRAKCDSTDLVQLWEALGDFTDFEQLVKAQVSVRKRPNSAHATSQTSCRSRTPWWAHKSPESTRGRFLGLLQAMTLACLSSRRQRRLLTVLCQREESLPSSFSFLPPSPSGWVEQAARRQTHPHGD